ncbi:MAG: hypothetical protein NT013_08015 [Planctomycetia bacterium]|nr:hypothetical protein [Planctomycetia bacterium]
MPVKVRCQSCDKVFGAPDAARGKSVKCPGCDERVKVPGGAGAAAKGKAPAKKKAAPSEHSHEEFLKNMDLDEVEDTNVKVCPKCGHEAGDEAMECESCGLNFESGLTKEKQKGVDPKIFFRVVLKDSMAFLKAHRSLALRTSTYSLVYSLAFLFFSFMIGWCISFPPRMFWMFLTVVAYMVPFGWVWFLDGEIIKATLEKREKMPRINFDMFTCVALGIKFHLWQIVMGIQLILPGIGAYLTRSGQVVPGAIVTLLGQILILLMLPQVMVHMVMPVQKRGWLAHVQFQALSKSFMGCAYWAVMYVVVMIPVILPVSLACALQQRALGEFAQVERANVEASSIQGADYAALRAAMNNPKKDVPLPVMDEKDPRYVQKPLPWKNIIIPGIGFVISAMLFGFGAVFLMRANGLLALYYKKLMKLDSMARETVWVDKKKLLENETPEQKKARKQKEMAMNSVAVVAFLAVIGGVAWYMFKPAGTDAAPAADAAPAGGAVPAGGAAPPAGGMPVQPGAGAAAGGVIIP